MLFRMRCARFALKLSIADQTEATSHAGFVVADRIHFGTHQLDAGFQGFKDLVLMPCLSVVCQHPIGGGPCSGCGYFFRS